MSFPANYVAAVATMSDTCESPEQIVWQAHPRLHHGDLLLLHLPLIDGEERDGRGRLRGRRVCIQRICSW